MLKWLLNRWKKKQQEQHDKILAFLLEHGESLGRNLWEAKLVSRASVYLVLQQMENLQLVQSRPNPGDMERLGAERRRYALTLTGMQRLRAIRHPATQPLPTMLH